MLPGLMAVLHGIEAKILKSDRISIANIFLARQEPRALGPCRLRTLRAVQIKARFYVVW